MKPKRTTDDIAAHLVACYEWKPAQPPTLPPADPEQMLCVSVPGESYPFRQTVATWDGEQFRKVNGTVLAGVTFWCWLPVTPEQMLAEANEARANAETEQPKLL